LLDNGPLGQLSRPHVAAAVCGRYLCESMDLTVFLEPKVDLRRISRVLDELGHSGRLDTIRGWDADQQAAIYKAAKGYLPLALEHFVPATVGAMTEVIHHGKNSLPAFTHFQKRFCRPPPVDGEASEGQLWGYNHQELQLWTGPGYFVAHLAESDGEVAIDYTLAPPGKPGDWPDLLPNSARLGRFVYYGTIDIMRGISKHVSIGRARRGEHWMNAWFVLCREDPG
jgi:hypothetical protein